MLLGLFIQPYYIKAATGVPVGELSEFFKNGIERYPQVVFGSNALFQVTAFLLPALIYAYLADPSPLVYLGSRRPGNAWQPVWVMLLAVSLIVVLSPVASWLKQVDLGATSRDLDAQRENTLKAYLTSGNVVTVLRNIFLIAVIPAVCEELFFRGVVMKFAHSLFKRWWLSVGISALVFAAFHTTISEFIPIFLAGLVLGWVYYATGSIWMNILLHFLFNGMQLLLSLYENPSLERTLGQDGVLLGLFAAGLLLAAAGIFLLRRSRSTLPQGWSVLLPLPPEERENGYLS